MGFRLTAILGVVMVVLGFWGGLATVRGADAPGGQIVTGVVVRASGDRIFLRTGTGSPSFAITANTKITVGGQAATAAALKEGMSAAVSTSDGKTATEIRAFAAAPKPETKPATVPATRTTVTGAITQVSRDRITVQSGDHTGSFGITSATTIRIGDRVVGAGDLKVGMTAAVVSADGKTALEIRASQAPATKPTTPPATGKFTGTITQVRGDGLTLKTGDHSANFGFTQATSIKVNGQAATGADLKAEMVALVVSADGKVATEIQAFTVTTGK